MRLLHIALTVGLLGIASGAMAEEQNRCENLVQNGSCVCAIPIEWVKEGKAAELNNIVGTVNVTGQGGLTPISMSDAPKGLKIADSVVVQPASSALLSMGTCQRQLPENSSLVIRQESDCACAALVTIPPPVPVIPIVAGGVGAAAIVTTVVLLGNGPSDCTSGNDCPSQ